MFEESVYLSVFFCSFVLGYIDGYVGGTVKGIETPQTGGGGGYDTFIG